MTDKKKQRRGGFYWIGNKPYPSVTQIIKVIDKSTPLMYWFGKEVYLACALNPDISQQEALAAPYKVSQKAKERGTSVHQMVENYQHGVVVAEAEQSGYYRALNAWFNSTKVEVLEHERTVFNEKERFAGTLDMLAVINSKLTVLDVKTSKKGDIYPEAFIQCSAYASCIPNCQQLAVLLLNADGSYKFEVRHDLDKQYKTFLAAKTIYETLHEDELKKVRY